MVFVIAFILVAMIVHEKKHPEAASEGIGRKAGYCLAGLIVFVILVHLISFFR